MALQVYLDDSGSHDGSPVLALAGFLAEESAWIDFDQSWNGVLDNPYWPSRLTEFKMYDCAHGEGEFLEIGGTSQRDSPFTEN